MTGFALRAAWASLRGRPGRTLLTAAGVAAAGLVLGVALSVAYALSTGFQRAADRADLPTIVARFDDQDAGDVDRIVRALPNLAAASYRYERTGVTLASPEGAHTLDSGVLEVVRGGRRGYAIVAGRDLRDRATGDVEVVADWHASGACTSASSSASGGWAARGSSASRWPPTTSPTRWPRPRASRSASGRCWRASARRRGRGCRSTPRCCGRATGRAPTCSYRRRGSRHSAYATCGS
jgi:hypothetical protein